MYHNMQRFLIHAKCAAWVKTKFQTNSFPLHKELIHITGTYIAGKIHSQVESVFNIGSSTQSVN